MVIDIALKITSSFEYGTTELKFDQAEKVDERGYTAGIAGFTTGTGDALLVLQEYARNAQNQPICSFIPRLQEIARKYEASEGDHPVASTKGLDGYCKAWTHACKDPMFIHAQLKIQDELYFNPAEEESTALGFEFALSRIFMFDSYIQHGESGIKRLLKSAGSPLHYPIGSAALPREIAWLRDCFIPAREHDILKNPENIGDDGKPLGMDRIFAFRVGTFTFKEESRGLGKAGGEKTRTTRELKR